MHNFSEFIIRHRLNILIVVLLITGFFATQIRHLKIQTYFDDLLPAGHSYVRLHKAVRTFFGGANKVTVVVKVKKGDIFNYETLSKVKRLTEAAQLLPCVNNYQIISLASRKVKDVRAIPGGIKVSSIMFPEVPESEDELQKLRRNVASNDFIYGSLVSQDFEAALLSIDFLEEGLDYKVLFQRLKQMCDMERDESHDIYMTGTPVLYGWVYNSFPQIIKIFLLTGLAIVVLLFMFARGDLRLVLLPLISAIMCGIWGAGLAGMLKYNIDPLLLVIPFLISADAVRHGFQISSRFFEEQIKNGKRKASAVITIRSLFLPCTVSLITDVAGAAFLIFSPMPILQKLAVVGSFWIFSIIIGVLILGPIVLSYFPVSEKAIKRYREKTNKPGIFSKVFDSTMMLFAKLPYRKKAAWAVLVLMGIILATSIYYGLGVKIGDIRPGSPILWPDSAYNKDFTAINKAFRASEPLYIVVKGDKPDAMKSPSIVHKIEDFQRYMEADHSVGYSVAVTDVIRKMNMVLYGDNPKREFLADTWDGIGYLYYTYVSQGEPGDFERFCDFLYRNANIQFYCLDHRGDTISRLLERARTFIRENPIKGANFELAAGLMGILGAANQEIGRAQIITVVLAFSFVFIFCWISFRSPVAAFILLLPLLFSNFLTFAFMAIKGIGLNVNTLPIASLGVGLGVDYGIYITSRIKEEYGVCGDLEKAIYTALVTSGRAVLATAITIVVSVILWAWAPLRFLAEMGILLGFWMGVVAIVALLLIPILIALIKPRFILKAYASSNMVK